MFSGHFASINVFRAWYPNVSPYILAIGVANLDLVFGVLSSFGMEGFSPDPHAGMLGVALHCQWSHSLVGSSILSAAYGGLCTLISPGTFAPAFVASMSHWVLDWVVHNHDLFFDPFSNILLGGTRFWSRFPVGPNLFKLKFCVALSFAAPDYKKSSTIGTNLFILGLRVANTFTFPNLLKQLLGMESPYNTVMTGVSTFLGFFVPTLIIGANLQTAAAAAAAARMKLD